MSNCSCKRIYDPSGIWTLEDLIGSRVKIHSLPISNFVALDCNEIFTIERIEFRVTMDGKAITIIFLKGLPDIEFTFKDLVIDRVIEGKKNELKPKHQTQTTTQDNRSTVTTGADNPTRPSTNSVLLNDPAEGDDDVVIKF